MYIFGTYINGKGRTVKVEILTGSDRAERMEIGTDGLYFTDEPVEITSEVNDTFDVLLPHSATIRLQTDRHIPELYTALCRNCAVNVTVGTEVVFMGFIEPLSYSQPFVSVADELELSCVDCLSALQYSNFKNVGSAGVDYDEIRGNAGRATLWSLMREILLPVLTDASISGGALRIFYDGSKAVNASNATKYTIFSDISISELLFLGDDKDDVDTQQDVLTEILRYLNLHIEQRGRDLYIFDWATMKGTGSVNWRDLFSGNTMTQARSTVALTQQPGQPGTVSDDSASIEIGEVYNRIELTADVQKIDTLVDDILDEDMMESPYTYNQLYLTHIVSEKTNHKIFRHACAKAVNRSLNVWTKDDGQTDGKVEIKDYYVRIMRHKSWTFPVTIDGVTEDIVDHFCGDGSTQDTILNYLGSHLGACLLRLGTATYTPDYKDNSPVSKISWETILYVGRHYGNGGSWGDLVPYETADTDLYAASPVAVYTGARLGASISPADTTTTNYIVISGKMAVVDGQNMPWMNAKWYVENWDDTTDAAGTYLRDRKRDGTNGDVYAAWQQWKRTWDARGYWWDAPQSVSYSDKLDFDRFCKPSYWVQGMVPLNGKFESRYPYDYSAAKDKTDAISKLGLLACMLRVGDKVCVEHDAIDGASYSFTWETYRQQSECATEDEYWNQCIFLGIDPKNGDPIFNKEYSLANNVTVDMGIDAEGMAIPITKADNLSGDVRFEILGLVNLTWDEYKKRHKTWFRKEKWSAATQELLKQMKAVIVKKLDITLESDNGFFDPLEDEDLVYVSDTDESYVNVNDSQTFRITSDLTAEEAAALGTRTYPKLSAPYKGDETVTQIYDRTKDTTAKPEQLYVDSYYAEYHTPRVTMDVSLEERGGRLTKYTHGALEGKQFYIVGESMNADGTTTLKLKETDD